MLFTIAIQNGATTTTDIAVRDLRDGTQTLVVRGGSDATSGGGGLNLWWRSADGNGAPERLTNTTNFQNPSGISPDGQRIVLHEATSSGIHIFQLTLDAEHRQTQLVTAGSGGVVSPDGRWLAFGSALSGRGEVYVRPYPNTEAGLWQITTTGARGVVTGRQGAVRVRHLHEGTDASGGRGAGRWGMEGGRASEVVRSLGVRRGGTRSHSRAGRSSVADFDQMPSPGSDPAASLCAIDDALESLARLDSRRAQVIELRFFGGLTVEETAEALGVSPQTVMRDWRLARAWLARELHVH